MVFGSLGALRLLRSPRRVCRTAPLVHHVLLAPVLGGMLLARCVRVADRIRSMLVSLILATLLLVLYVAIAGGCNRRSPDTAESISHASLDVGHRRRYHVLQ